MYCQVYLFILYVFMDFPFDCQNNLVFLPESCNVDGASFWSLLRTVQLTSEYPLFISACLIASSTKGWAIHLTLSNVKWNRGCLSLSSILSLGPLRLSSLHGVCGNECSDFGFNITKLISVAQPCSSVCTVCLIIVVVAFLGQSSLWESKYSLLLSLHLF